jgi:hypothetical protein
MPSDASFRPKSPPAAACKNHALPHLLHRLRRELPARRILKSQVHSRKLFVPAMKGCCSCGMLYKCVIASPFFVGLLLKLHFDLYVFVDDLNHQERLRRGIHLVVMFAHLGRRHILQ